MTPEVIALVGPTATGKTDLAIHLAEHLGGEVVNADALQFYRGLDIGTAKVTPEETRGIAHHLIDIYDLSTEASVAEFQTLARAALADIRSRGKVAIVTGGSGLYVRAALDTLEFPPTDPEVRAAITAEVADLDRDQLRARLATVDPVSAEKMQDARRMIRALEVHRLTGRTFSSYLPERRYHPELGRIVQIGLDIDRPLLSERIAERVHRMVHDQGWLDEVAALRPAGLAEAPTASKAIGYQQLLAHLDGTLSLDEAIDQTIIATRKFAKRQQTWFRADPRVRWIDATADALLPRALKEIENDASAT